MNKKGVKKTKKSNNYFRKFTKKIYGKTIKKITSKKINRIYVIAE